MLCPHEAALESQKLISSHVMQTQGPGSAFSCPEAARAERIASRQASTNASEAALSADGASPAGEEMPGSKLQAALAHSQTNGLSHGAKVAEASQV